MEKGKFRLGKMSTGKEKKKRSPGRNEGEGNTLGTARNWVARRGRGKTKFRKSRKGKKTHEDEDGKPIG